MSEHTFKDKVAPVTGGEPGIGRAAAMMLAARGAKVAVADLEEKEYAAHNIRINSLCPGATKTPLLEGAVDVDGLD